MYTKDDLNEVINELLHLISDEISIKEVYLFGSYANGNARQYSDIDLAIVSDDFEGDRFADKKMLNKFVLKTSIDFELHPFKTEEFTLDNPFVKEIISTGNKIL